MAVARDERGERHERQETHVGLRHHPKAVGESSGELTSSRDAFEAGDALTSVAALCSLGMEQNI